MCAGDIAAAQDVTQDVFVRLMEKGPTKHTEEAVSSWLLTVADRMCIDLLRRERSAWARLKSAVGLGPPQVDRGNDDRYRDEALLHYLQQALSRLPPAEYEVIVRKYVEGRKQTDIAIELNRSQGYVSKLLARAVARLREMGWEVDDV
jgi:RNA polymerase sigma-70 factor (ECF subfamily)